MQIPTFYYHHIYNEYEELIGGTAASIRKYHRGSPIYTMVESMTYYYYIRSGMVALYMNGENGQRKMLLLCGEGMIFPIYRHRADYKTNYTISFEARGETEAYYLSETRLQGLLQNHSRLMMRTLNTALDVLDLYTYSLMDASYNDSLRKISNILYLLGMQAGGGRTGERLYFSQDDLAAASGCSRPQTTRQLGYLSRKKIIATYRGSFEILDFKQLEQMCSEDIKPD